MSVITIIKNYFNPPVEVVEKVPRTLTVEEIVDDIRELLRGEESSIFQDAAAGDDEAKDEAIQKLARLIDEELITVEGMTSVEAAAQVFIAQWGNSVIDQYLRDESIDEIVINDAGYVWIQKNGVFTKIDKQINNDPNDENNEVRRIIQNMTPRHEFKSVLTKTSAVIRYMMSDSSRVTAMGPPVTRSYVIMIRKRDRIKKAEDIINYGTIDRKNWDKLSLLVKGMTNILVSGGVGTGKSTTLEILAGEINPTMVIRAIDQDNELRLSKLYPNRNIIEMEAHPEASESMDDLAKDVLGMSPKVIIVGEFRASGEAKIAVRQGLSGHQVLSTAHFQNPEEAVFGTARMLMTERVNMQYNEAKIEVANAFNVIVQIAHDGETGVRKIEEITEVYTVGDEIKFNPIIKWVPSTDIYLGEGEWVQVGYPSEKLISKMKRHNIPESKIKEVFGGGDN